MAVEDPTKLEAHGSLHSFRETVARILRGLYRKVSDTSLSVGMDPTSATASIQAHLTVAQGGIAIDSLENWHEIGAASEPGFGNSWVNFGSGWDTAAFTKDATGAVWIKGLLKDGNFSAVAFTLPAGERPAASIMLGQSTSGPAHGEVHIQADGDVFIRDGANTYVGIECSFKAAG